MAVFTPMEATIGGATLGVATAAHMAVNGRILGHSGVLKGILHGDRALWRPVFVAGMAAGSVAALNFMPGAFVELPATYSISRAAVSGVMVGLGSALGNGCTSGHGICGLSRLSLRSAAYVGTFMSAGAVAASFSGITEAVGLAGIQTTLTPSMPAPAVLSQGVGMLAAAVAVSCALWFAASRLKSEGKKVVNMATEVATGAMFAGGLAFSQMTHSSKVGSFLAVADKCWDPSLMFVMAGGILVTLPIFQAILNNKVLPETPPAADKYEMPTSSTIDAKLIIGGILFGAGWGTGGMCPGPAVANLAAYPLNPIYQAFFVAMLAGMALERTSAVQDIFKQKGIEKGGGSGVPK